MTEKELKKLNRYQLLELLVMQTERADGLQRKIEELEARLEDRELRFSQLGSVSEAAVYISGVLDAAQKTADLYLEAARKQADELLAEAGNRAQELIARAEQDCLAMAQETQKPQPEEKRSGTGYGKYKKAKKKRTSKNRRTKK